MVTLEGIISELRMLDETETLAERIAARATGKLEAGLRDTLNAGTTPEGKKWKDRKIGGRAYENAASSLSVKSSGNLVYAVVSGPEAWAQFGTSKLPIRKMLPDGGGEMPPIVESAITSAAKEILDEITGSK